MFNHESLSLMNKNGYLVALMAAESLVEIQAELEPWKHRPAINGYGCIHHSDDALLQNLALYSPASLRWALNENILAFCEEVFREPVLLGKIEYRRSLIRKAPMPTHTDTEMDITVFVYLNGVNSKNGATYVLPGTHNSTVELGMKVIEGPPGTILAYFPKLRHGRSETVESGRELLWLTYCPVSRAKNLVELVLPRRAFAGLSDRQYRALGLGYAGIMGEDYRLSSDLDPRGLEFASPYRLVQALSYKAVERIRRTGGALKRKLTKTEQRLRNAR